MRGYELNFIAYHIINDATTWKEARGGQWCGREESEPWAGGGQ